MLILISGCLTGECLSKYHLSAPIDATSTSQLISCSGCNSMVDSLSEITSKRRRVNLQNGLSYAHSLFHPHLSNQGSSHSGDFLLACLIVALLAYFLTNRLLISPTGPTSVMDNRVEFAYAFDVAVNSFFPAFLTVGMALLPLAPVVVGRNWVSLFFGK